MFSKEYIAAIDKKLITFTKGVKREQRDKYDVVIAITGYPGTGKTTLAIIMCWLTDNKYTFEKNVCLVPTAPEIEKKYYGIEEYGVMHIDEASRALHKYRWWDSAQQKLNTLYDSVAKDTDICFYDNDEFERMSIEEMYNKYSENPKNLRTFVIDDNFKVIQKPIKKILQRPIRQPSKRMFKIRTRFNKEILVTEDHSLFVFKNRGEKIVKISPTDLKLKDKLIILKNLPSIETINEDNDKMQVYGAWLADGNYRFVKGSPTTIQLSGLEHKEVFERLSKKFPNNKGTGIKCYNRFDYCFHNTKFVKDMISKGFIGNSHTKRVPSWVFNTSKENKIAFLKGFMTGDGSINFEGRARVSSVNKELLRDIQILLMMIGIPTGWTSEKRTNHFKGYKNGSISNHLEISTCFHKEYINLFEPTKKNYKMLENFNPIKGNMISKRHEKYIKNECICAAITKIEEITDYKGYIYDLSIDGIHRFIGNDILVSNTEREGHYKATIFLMPRFQDLNPYFRNFRVRYWVNIIDRGVAIVYKKDEDKDAKDPWHLDENYSYKYKKWWLMRKRISERSISDVIRVEEKLPNYWFWFEFPQLPKEMEDRFSALKKDSRIELRKQDAEKEKPGGVGKREKAQLNTIYFLWKAALKENPKLTYAEFGRKGRYSPDALSNLVKRKEAEDEKETTGEDTYYYNINKRLMDKDGNEGGITQ